MTEKGGLGLGLTLGAAGGGVRGMQPVIHQKLSGQCKRLVSIWGWGPGGGGGRGGGRGGQTGDVCPSMHRPCHGDMQGLDCCRGGIQHRGGGAEGSLHR